MTFLKRNDVQLSQVDLCAGLGLSLLSSRADPVWRSLGLKEDKYSGGISLRYDLGIVPS